MQVMIGELPGDFLRVSGQQQQMMMADERIAQILQAQQQAGFMHPVPANVQGRLSLTVAQVSSHTCWVLKHSLHTSFHGLID